MASQKGQVVSSARIGEVSINLDKLNNALQGAIAESLRQLTQETRGTAKIAVVKTVAPAEAIEPPCAGTALTVVNACADW